MRRLHSLVLRHLLGPVLVERLHLEPGDLVLVKVPSNTSADEAMELSRRMCATFPGHRPIVTDGSLRIEALPREYLLALIEAARPSSLPYGVEI